MSLKNKLIKIFNGFENLFFKNHSCLACRREVPDGTDFSLCQNCFNKIDRIVGNKCEICGDKILENNKFCDKCKNVKYAFDQNRSFAIYEDVVSLIIKKFKYSAKKYYSKYIAELMTLNKEYFSNIDVITFVPIGKKRRKERGFNQAEELAFEISRLTNIEILDAFEKLGSERHQAGLSQQDRQRNLAGSFKLKENVKEKIKGKNILIIDDVFTTGATLSECASVLRNDKKNMPNKIYCYTFAKTRLNSTNTGQIQQKNF